MTTSLYLTIAAIVGLICVGKSIWDRNHDPLNLASDLFIAAFWPIAGLIVIVSLVLTAVCNATGVEAPIKKRSN